MFKYLAFLVLVLTFTTTQTFEIEEKSSHHDPILGFLVEFTKENPELFDYVNQLIEYADLDPFKTSDKKIDPIKCTACKVAVKRIHNWAVEEMKISDYIVQLASKVCIQLNLFAADLNAEVCEGLVSSQAPVWFEAFWLHYTNPDFLCPAIKYCNPVYEKVDIDALISDILKDKPKHEQLVPEQKNTVKFIQLTDLHTDLNYKEGALKTCGAPTCCREDTGMATSDEEACGYWGSIATSDIPERTFEQMVNFIENRVEDIDFIIWTGDNTSHNLWNQSAEQNVENTQKQTEYMMKTLSKDIQVIPIFGNHEEYPANIYKFYDDSEVEFKKFFGDIWKEWLGKDLSEDLTKDGFYEVEIQDGKLKIIVLNTQACYDGNVSLVQDPTDPDQILDFMRKSLDASEKKNNQPVYIMAHIPTNKTCFNTWSKVFNALVDRYSYIIRGIFGGHSHADELEIFYDSETEEAINATFIAPSLTTYSNRNPSFRVFEVDADTYQVLNYYQYRLDLNYWNQFTDPNTELLWEVAYDFVSYYELPNMYEYPNIDKVRQEVGTNLETYNKYMFNYQSGVYEAEDEISKSKYCRMLSTNTLQAECLGLPFYPDIIEFLAGPWFTKKK